MSIIRKGATKQYADGWEMAFGGKKSNKSAGSVAVKVKKKAPKKKAGKKKR